MAKSKAGGTRAYIRGKIGADVYSIGKDGKGRKQQVVRSLAEQVKNPQTTAQMKGRMIMSTIMQAVASMSVIIDHSFDNVPNGQPCISEFIRLNYGLIKTDVANNPSSGNRFGLNKYHEKGLKCGIFRMSSGTALLPECIDGQDNGRVNVTLAANDKYSDLWTKLGLAEGEFITIVGIKDGAFTYARLTPDRTKTATTVVSQSNFLAAFVVEGNMTLAVAAASNVYTITDNGSDWDAVGVIVSKKQGAGYVHNDCQLDAPNYSFEFAADTALPTYPTGEEMFLNGGDI